MFLSGCAGAPPQIISLDPVNGSTGVPADTAVRIAFDHAIDRASIPSRLHVDPAIPGCPLADAFTAGPGAPCRVTWSADSTVLTLLHRGAIFRSDTRYRFSLDPGVADAQGITNSLDHHWELTSTGAPGVRSLSPADGSTDVPLDAPVDVGFSAAMETPPTAAAVALSPAVAGTRVLPNASDQSRFVVLPGALLAPRTRYTVTVAPTALDAHGAPLGTALVAHFTTGSTLGARGHALVLTGSGAGAASSLLLTATAPDQSGDPVAAATVLSARRCGAASGCGVVAEGEPLEAFSEAVLAPGGDRLAVTVRDLTGEKTGTTVELRSLASAAPAVQVAVDAEHPSWSPDGRYLAYGTGSGIDVLPAAGGVATALPSGDRLAGLPVWAADGNVLAFPTGTAGLTHLEMADVGLRLRYPVPGVPPPAGQPALSPDGSLLAFAGGAAGLDTAVVALRGGDAAPRRLGPGLRPLAFVDPGTLVAVATTPSVAGTGAVVRISVATAEVDPVGDALPAASLPTVVAAPGGRLLGFLRPGVDGIPQAWVENADGSNPLQVTAAVAGGLIPLAVSLSA